MRSIWIRMEAVVKAEPSCNERNRKYYLDVSWAPMQLTLL